MKGEGQISQKAKQLRFRHLKRELDRLLAQTSRNCEYNTLVTGLSGTLGVCRLDCKTCDPNVTDRADSCGSFKALLEKDKIKESLKTFFETRPPEEIAVRFPDVAALQWVLDPGEGSLFPAPVATLFGVPVWVETEDELKEMRRIFSELEKTQEGLLRDQERLLQIGVLLDSRGEEVIPALQKKMSELNSQSLALEDERKTSTEKTVQISLLQGELKTARNRLGLLEGDHQRTVPTAVARVASSASPPEPPPRTLFEPDPWWRRIFKWRP